MKPVDLTKLEIMVKQDVESSVACSVRKIVLRDLNLGLRPVKLVNRCVKNELKTIVN